MTPATPAALHASRAAAAHAFAADAAAPSQPGSKTQFAEQLLQAQKAPQQQFQPQPQPHQPSAPPAAPARQPGSTASRDERMAADRAAERQAARREQPVGKQPAAPKDPAAPAATPAEPQPAPTPRGDKAAADAGRDSDADADTDAAQAHGDEAPAAPAASDAEAVSRPAQAAAADDATAPVDWLAAFGLSPLPGAPALPQPAAGSAVVGHELPPASGLAGPLGGPAIGHAATAANPGQEPSAREDVARAAVAAIAADGGASATLGATAASAMTATAAAGADAPRPLEAASPALPHLPGLAAAVPGSGTGAATPTAQIATPLHAPDFGQALAAQLTTFARDGVQEASLQLNPAEMGPIDVKIVVDGQKAQIDFSAAHAATRQVLQDGLPGLAAALHAGGLTLAGGGVFEQRQPARDPDSAPRGRAAGKGERRLGGVEAAGRPAALPAARGLLDLYA